MFRVVYDRGSSGEMSLTEAVVVASEMSERVPGEVRVVGFLGTEAAFCAGIRTFPESSSASLSEVGKHHIVRVLEAHGWNVPESAKVLKVGKSTLYRLIAVHKIARASRAHA